MEKNTNNKIQKPYFFLTKTVVLCNIGDLVMAYGEDNTVNNVIYFDKRRNKLTGSLNNNAIIRNWMEKKLQYEMGLPCSQL